LFHDPGTPPGTPPGTKWFPPSKIDFVPGGGTTFFYKEIYILFSLKK
jgi:hypothetical protein